ncbi:MAG: TRAP transporter substrate-binding protein DctP, partial [Actinobacteria bacterium]|nr:TRAP transporter substrate-binding protein DctP [Actinomycetota bacterium]
PPLLALINQWFGLANYMVDVKWAPLIGTTMISKRAWRRIPEALRPSLIQAAREAGEKLRGDIRKLGDDAVTAMQKRGLTVIRVDETTLSLWRAEAEAIYPELRGRIIPADLFDEVRRLRNEFRTQQSGAR